MKRFHATLQPVPHGGCYVVVAPEVAAAAGVGYRDRARGTVNGAPYRSTLAKYSGVLHLGIPKATLAGAGVRVGDRVRVTIEPDPELRPGDVVPEDLARALDAHAGARAAFERLSPAHRREHVKHVIEAKRAETRARRIERTVRALVTR